jgi:pimeloyl-ACP methyl ester carboxylesterase
VQRAAEFAATDSANRIDTTFFNPGGVGGAGTEELPNWYRLFPATLRARFALVSWDPRGVGASSAVQCFRSDRREARFLGQAVAAFPRGRAQRRLWTLSQSPSAGRAGGASRRTCR